MANRDDFEIRGVVPIVPTPFLADGSVDWSSVPALIDFAIAAGACAVCLPAYASEFYKLSPAEHERIIETALLAAGGRIPVVAQVNTPSLPRARELAVLAGRMGSAAINVAVPRLFAIGEANLFRYFDEILKIISLPMIIQDFNPGGPSVSVDFIAKLHREHPHFRYVKLEEPMLSGKVRAILEATSGGVGVIAGWGGMYFPELVPAGICGIMPGLAVADRWRPRGIVLPPATGTAASTFSRTCCPKSSTASRTWNSSITPRNGCFATEAFFLLRSYGTPLCSCPRMRSVTWISSTSAF